MVGVMSAEREPCDLRYLNPIGSLIELPSLVGTKRRL
jgi:hypothetical protein